MPALAKPILMVTAPYYRAITQALIEGAHATIAQAGFSAEIIDVPGALEIPAAIAIASGSHRYSAFVALGCVIRGETTHYDTVVEESARGLMDLSLRERLAIGNGILTCETLEQAAARADISQGNKGGQAAEAAIALLKLHTLFHGAS